MPAEGRREAGSPAAISGAAQGVYLKKAVQLLLESRFRDRSRVLTRFS